MYWRNRQTGRVSQTPPPVGASDEEPVMVVSARVSRKTEVLLVVFASVGFWAIVGTVVAILV